jgi:TolB-like protein/Tfp pilus assembly protein PilF
LALAAGLIGMAAAAFVLFARWHNRAMSQNAAPANVSEKSIAVLPFDNLSHDQANANFAVGVQDEILTGLAKIANLKVISRTSVMQYKTGGKRNLREIGQQLGVAHVLEGSVQRAGNRVRVNAQLIDARNDAHLWAQTYDRDLADVFAIQSEIAKTIAQQLKAELSLQEKGAMEKPPTTDFVAYELFLRAVALVIDTGSGMLPNSARLPQAVRLLDEAVTRDPHFVRAWCLLSKTHSWFYFNGNDHTPTRRDLAKTAVQAALRLQPDGGEPHLALAAYCYCGFRDFGRARSELAIASRTLPNDPEVFEYTAYIDRREGRWEEATRNMERVVELDPRNLGNLRSLTQMYHYQRRYADELRTYDRALTIAPGDPDTLLDRATVALDWRADIKPYQTMQGAMIAEKFHRSSHDHYMLCQRSAAAATRLLRNYPREGVDDGVNVPYSYWKGVVARWQGDSGKSQTAFTAARSEVEKAVDKRPDFPEALSLLGMINAGLGRKEEALSQGRRACELVPITKDALVGVHFACNLAQIYAWTGEKDLAIEQIEMIQRFPNPLSYGWLKLHPYWDSLRGDPRFEKIVASLGPEAADVPAKSIAVLPFENRSEDKENAFLADGLQDDVLTSLVKIKDLKVIGRSSVMSYRDGTKRNLREIGQELGVAHVLEGSVRRVADRMLIYVNLTDTRDGRAVWAERYDRTLADVTGLQGELAIEIAGALRARLAPAEKASLQTKTTDNPDAYVLYLRGREYQMRPENSQDNNLAAEKFYRQAITLDPRFALARARLATIEHNLYGFFDRSAVRLAEAKINTEEALRIDPNCGQAHMALAHVLFGPGGGTHEEMKREIATAVRLLPNDAYIVLDAAMFQDELKWFDEAAASYERAIVLNPREGKVFYNYAVFLYDRNDIPRARWASDRALELSPDSIYFRLFRAKAEIEWTGDLAGGKAVLADLPKGKDPDGRVTAARCSIAVWERNFPEALRLLAACSVDRIPGLEMGFGAMVPKSFIQGMVQLFAGDREGAYATMDSARWILEVEAKENAGDTEAHFLVALTYAAMGWKDAAKAEAARSKEKLDDFQMAVLFAHLGEVDLALTALEGAALKPEFRRVYLRLDPDWDAVRNNPRFQKILAGPEPKTVHK